MKFLSKSKLVQLINAEGDSIQDFLAWTRKQPRIRMASTSALSGGIWEEMTLFLKARLDGLPSKITKETIFYLYSSQESKDWMLYSIIIWILSNNESNHLDTRYHKIQVLSHFRKIQIKRLAHLPVIFKIVQKHGKFIGIAPVKRKK